MPWRYTDESLRFVSRDIGDGLTESCHASLVDGEDILPPVIDLPLIREQAVDQIRIERQPIIAVLDGLQATSLTKGDTATAIVIETAKQALRDLTKIDLSGCETLADMKVAVLTRYAQIASASPALKSAFSQATK